MLGFVGGFEYSYAVMIWDAVGVESHKGFIYPAGVDETSDVDDHLFTFMAPNDEAAYAYLSGKFRAKDARPLRGKENLKDARVGAAFL